MAKPTGEIARAAQPVKVGAQWHVVGTYPRGQQEHITGFKTEADALDWIATDSADWLEKRRSARLDDEVIGLITRVGCDNRASTYGMTARWESNLLECEGQSWRRT